MASVPYQVRYFVAVWPTEEVLDALGALPRPEFDGARWSTRDQWHVTLRFFGELDQAGVARASRALAKAAAHLSGPLEARGGPSTRFMGPGLIIWPVEGLAEAARTVERVTAKIGKPPPSRAFRGHLTVARARGEADLRQAGQLLAPLEMSWEAGSLSLVRSELHPNGARYTEVAVFPLGRQAPERQLR